VTEGAKNEPVDYESLAQAFNQALLDTLRKHSIADTFLDYWVPDADPVLGIAGMADSARIAGLAAIAIRFNRTTVPEARLPDLEQAVGRFAQAKLERNGDTLVLHATAMTRTPGETAATRARKGTKAAWQADKLDSTRAGSSEPSGWASDELPEFGDVHQHFRAGLKEVLGALSHEGVPPAREGLVRVQGREGPINLTLDIDPAAHTVSAAQHTGATRPSERAALDLFCRAAETLPVQEVADHVGLKVVDSLVDEDKAPPMGGILLPVNAGAPFMLAPRLARQAYDAYRATMALGRETNFYYAPPSQRWQALSSAERREKLVRVLRGFLQSEELYPDDMELLRLEKNKTGYEVRGVVGFSDRIEIENKPFLMRRLEQRLRRDLEPEIELVADRAKDKSPLRRLS
jgi:hypothetical protein